MWIKIESDSIINFRDICTLVTAGIYLLLRCSPILEYSPTALLVITIVGASTAFFAATCGLVANDLKRIIAMSTISQLGYCLMLIMALLFNFDDFIFTTNDSYFLSFLPFFKTNILNHPPHGDKSIDTGELS